MRPSREEARLDPTVRLATDRDALTFGGGAAGAVGRAQLARQARGEALILVAEHAGAVVGQVWIDLASPGKALLWALHVAPERRRRGIGRSLVAQALRAAARSGRTRAELMVRADAPALALYLELGFTAVRSVDGNLVLELSLRPDGHET